MRQNFFEKGRTLLARLTIKELYALIKSTDAYKALPAKVSNQVVKQIIHDWKAWKEAVIAYRQDTTKFLGEPKIPKYKHKALGRNLLTYDVQSIGQRGKNKNNGLLVLSQTNITVNTAAKDVIEVRVVPSTASYVVEVVFEKPVSLAELSLKLVAGIDLGLDNLATLVSNKPGFRPILVDGKKLKSINQGYNKRKAHLQSKLAQGKHSSKQIQQITYKRNKRVDNYLHLTSRLIVNRLVEEGIGKLVIGQNESWKQKIELEKKNNQNFVNIPHTKLIDTIAYKAQLVGIEVVVTEESYTSKTSFLDLEPVGKHESYQGRRVKRGLFKSAIGTLINADVNGAFNIIRKVSGNEPFLEVSDRVEVFAVSPVRVSPVRKPTRKVS